MATENTVKVTRIRKIKLHLNPEQKVYFKRWLGTTRYVYNKSIEDISEALKNQETFLKGQLRTKIVTNYENSWEAETPQGVREGAVFEAYNAYKTNLKMAKQNKSRFDMKYRSKKADSQVFNLPVDALKSDMRLYPKIMGRVAKLGANTLRASERQHLKWREKVVNKLKKILKKDKNGSTSEVLEKIPTVVGHILEHAIKVQYTRTGKWYLCVPIEVNVLAPENQGGKRIISLDPGIRSFLTGYCPDGTALKIGHGDINKIRKYLLKTDKLVSKITKLIGKKRRRHQKAKLKRFENVRNWIKDCHRKTVKYLLEQADVVLLPIFQVKNLSQRGLRKISNQSVRNMYTWSHYRFRQMLLDKAEELGKVVLHPTEEYTSQTCGRCGNLDSNLGRKELYQCGKCGLKIDRDLNGARNILLKFLEDENLSEVLSECLTLGPGC